MLHMTKKTSKKIIAQESYARRFISRLEGLTMQCMIYTLEIYGNILEMLYCVRNNLGKKELKDVAKHNFPGENGAFILPSPLRPQLLRIARSIHRWSPQPEGVCPSPRLSCCSLRMQPLLVVHAIPCETSR